MKKMALLLPVVFVAAVAGAQTSKPGTHPTKPAKEHAMTTHEVTAEIVAADLTHEKLTVRMGTSEKTVPVEGKAIASLKSVKPGETVTLTCRDNEAGEHTAITAIVPASAPKK